MRLSQSQKESLERTTSTYETAVDAAAAYLTGRGLTQEVARIFRLGYVSDPLVGDEDYKGRLAIPYLTPTGVVDIRYRSVHGEQPKYMSRPGAKTRLFNPAALQVPSDYIAVCEGEFDTIITHGLCGIPAVGVPGANNWQPHFRILLADYLSVYVLADGDSAGREFAKTIAREVDGVRVVHMPDGMDVNDVFKAEGPDGIRKRVGLT